MANKEFRERIARLGYSQVSFARFAVVNDRTVRRWALAERDIPSWVGVMLALMEEIGPDRLRDIMKDAE